MASRPPNPRVQPDECHSATLNSTDGRIAAMRLLDGAAELGFENAKRTI